MKPKLDLATVVGVISGLGILLGAIFLGGGVSFFFNVPSMLIVVGGTIAATLINFPLREVLRVMKVTPRAFSSSFEEPTTIMHKLIALCTKAKKEGFLGIESEVKKIDNTFLKSGILQIIDGVPQQELQRNMNLQKIALQERHKTGRKVFESMGVWAPAFGMIGTLIGLVQMMANMSDPKSIGPKMAVALLTTFYGAVMSNLIFLPMAGKLKRLDEIETTTNDIVMLGLSGIRDGTTPSNLENRLKSYLETGRQEKKLEVPAGVA